jgi:hypothetical protein
VGRVVDQPRRRRMPAETGVHPLLHGGVLNQDEPFVRDALGT